MLSRSATVVSHHFRNGQELKWLCSVTKTNANVCYRTTDKEVTGKKEPKIGTHFHLLIPCIENQSDADGNFVTCLLIPHTCINQSEEENYFVKCTPINQSQAFESRVKSAWNIKLKNTDNSSKRKKVKLTEDGYLEIPPKIRVKIDHPLTALLDGVTMAIYKERKDEYADKPKLDESRLIIPSNRRIIIDGHATHGNLFHKIFRQLLDIIFKRFM